MYEAKIVKKSINPVFGDTLTAFDITIPRIVLAEFNTHKIIAKNSASSRAIPVQKMIDSVQNDPFIPMKWFENVGGMSSDKEITDPAKIQEAKELWLNDRDFNVYTAHQYMKKDGLNLTKQIANRILEPWLWHPILASATEWQNFFALRAHDAAQPEIQTIAYMMLELANNTKGEIVEGGKWAIAYDRGDQDDTDFRNHIYDLLPAEWDIDYHGIDIEELKLQVAIARAARRSYYTPGQENKGININKDVDLYNKLLLDGHMSPFEHPGLSMTEEQYFAHYVVRLVDPTYVEYNNKDFEAGKSKVLKQIGDYLQIQEFGWSGHYRGFIPYRKLIGTENRLDTRLALYGGQ